MRRILMTVTIVASMFGVAAIAFGAIPASDGTIGACYGSDPAAQRGVRFVDNASQCNEGESFLKFSQQGPKGDAGLAGPAGAAGAAGAPGAAGAAGGGSGGGGYAVPDEEAFIKIDGIPGESADAKHPGQIDVLAFDHGAVQATTAGGSGAGTGKASFRDLSFVHAIDKATPALFLATATGKHIKDATLTVRRAGGEKFEYYKVTLKDVLVSSVREHTQDPPLAGGPVENVSLHYGKIEVTYIPQKPDGSAGSAVKATYDVKANKAL